MSATTVQTDLISALEKKLSARTARAGVIGLGYVGLPLAVELSRAGLEVVGFDLDARKVDAINRGESYIPDVPASEVAEFRRQGKLSRRWTPP